MEEFRVSVAERVAMLAAPNLSAVEKSHLEAELRATLFDIVGTPVWIIFGLLDQCVDVAFGLSTELGSMAAACHD